MPPWKGAAAPLLPFAALAVAAALYGCHGKSAAAGRVDAPPAPVAANDATAFLQWSMGRYQALKSLSLTCDWTASESDAPKPLTTRRTLEYQAPNRYKGVVKMPDGASVTAVSDGESVVDFQSDASHPAIKAPAPSTIADAHDMPMVHPAFLGSLLYKFFTGPSGLPDLVDSRKGAVKFGQDATVDGQPCRTVSFYAAGTYGKTDVVIGEKDGLVRRIQYGSEPVLERLRAQPNTKVPDSAQTTEIYTNLKPDVQIAEADFKPVLPAGMQLVDPLKQMAQQAPVPLGRPAPDFEVASINGSRVKLSEMRGKVVLIDFWATWCGPCRLGLPETQKLDQEFGKKGLAVLAVSNEDKPTVQPFLAQNHYTFPCYLDDSSAASQAFHVTSLPTVAIIDRKGNLSAYMIGLQDPNTIRGELKKAGLAI